MLIKLVTKILPKPFLPTASKCVNGKHIPLEVHERREFLHKNLTHKKEQFLNKASPIRKIKKKYKSMKLKNNQKEFYSLMGQIALTHAGIEQDIKNVLMCDWDVPENFKEEYFHEESKTIKLRTVKVDELFGERLKKRFFKEIKKRLIPDGMLKGYKQLYKELHELSLLRNKSVKAIHSFNTDGNSIHKIIQKNHGKFKSDLSYDEMVSSWMPVVNLIEHNDLLDKLIKIRQKFRNLQVKVSIDKSALHSKLCCEIGKTYPGYAFKNPYIYQFNLKNSGDK